MRLRTTLAWVLGAMIATAAPAYDIIDMHLHAFTADSQGPPPIGICAPYEVLPDRDVRLDPPHYVEGFFKHPPCAKPLWSAKSDDELRTRTIAILTQNNILAVASGPPPIVEAWSKTAPANILPAVDFGWSGRPSIADLRALHAAGRLKVIGELELQYEGIAPDDPRLDPYFTLAEELDVPIAIHMGPGPPGASYMPGVGAYRARLSNPLALEEVLVKHPRLRLYVMHAGWPFSEAMIALLYAHPQVYVDVGVIDYVLPRAEFEAYLKRLVEAGFGRRVMFGSDQMVWPDAIPVAIDRIKRAPFLTEVQKRDILHDNAARFLRLPAGD